ncbi:MAG TPA: hypothetical protein VLF90_02195 [Patescibacteria group bacterium]|nr:hypothetical protein [Patescibacteria group bacterium]
MKFIDSILNRIAMYRLVVYGLASLAVAGILLAAIGRISLNPVSMTASLTLLLGACYFTEQQLSKIWQIPYNKDSWLITALIMFLIIRPPHSVIQGLVIATAGVIAISSKYLITWHGRHVFNPAALGAAYLSLGALQTTSWWVGNSTLWPLTLVIGLAIVRKIRRFPMVLTFVIVSMALQLVLIIHTHQSIHASMQNALIASPLIFLSTIMLSDPATMPPRRTQQIVFASIVAILYITAWKVGELYIYPEVALLIGTGFAFLISPKFKATLKLQEIHKISDQVYDFIFKPDKKFAFIPGQYMEWTLPDVAFDSRGNRRTFTIASSPTEDKVHLGVKFYNPSSTFKYTMSKLKPGDPIFASQLAGNFTLNNNEKNKLAFIAGGIGITPFRSMVKYITDKNIKCDITIIYIVSKPEELAYKEEFLAAKSIGVKLIPILSNGNQKVPGMISANLSSNLIEQTIPDYESRIFYISGPDAMVNSAKHLLRSMNLEIKNIKTDHFSGY